MFIRSFLAASLLALATAAQAEIVIKFSHVVSIEAPKGQAALFFARRAQELTDGQVKVLVYPNSVLYKDKDEMDALLKGDVQMLAPSLAKFSGLGAPQFEVFDLPFLFNSMSDVHRITEGPVGASLMTKLEPHGVKGLAYWDNGFKSFSAKTPIKTPEDLKGRKLRIQASKVLDAQMKALGAIPVPLAFSAVYDSLQSGATEGTENPISNFYTKKFREVQKYLTLTEHGYLGYAVIANKKFWDGLPSEIRRELSQAMKETTVYANKIAQQDNDGMVQAERLTRHIAIYEPSEAERQAFRKALWPVHAKMSERIGADIIQQFYKELGTVPPQP